MIKRFSEFVNEGWAAGSMKRAAGGNLRMEEMPNTVDELRDIIIKRINSEGNKCDLNDIDVSKIDDMSLLFCANSEEKESNAIFKDFNGDISRWDVSKVWNMSQMFDGCENFNGNISGWEVSSVNFMTGMFKGCKNFNQDLSRWDVSNVENMAGMFYECTGFYKADRLEEWEDKLINCKDTKIMFNNCPVKPSWYKK